MRQRTCLTFLLLSFCLQAANAQDHQHHDLASKPAMLLPGMGNHQHPIATRSPDAQRFFDQGLTLAYGFNHDEAVRSFQRGAELDPAAAMPHWGIALALGPNINDPGDLTKDKAAHEAIQRALTLAAKGPAQELAYINALARRYSDDPKANRQKQAVDYKNAMRELMNRYPDDLDAATLYAESLMDLRPWKLWTPDGKPEEGTEEIVAVLEGVLKRDPQHPGANHFHVHAVEASRNPERALQSAKRLETLVPAAGHLVHMPAHIYIQTGDHEAASRSNADAAEADRAFMRQTGVKGMYPLVYLSHNLHFLAYSRSVQGRYTEARKAADELVVNVAPGLAEMPMLEGWMTVPVFVLAQFNRWDEILQLSAPGPKMELTKASWHYARALAYAGKGDLRKAESERDAFHATRKQIPEETPFGMLNNAGGVLGLASIVLDARLVTAKGDAKAAIDHWKRAVVAQNLLAYDEPPAWYYPVRESLGAALYLNQQYAEAEQVFRTELERNPRSGRALFGLWESLKAQKKLVDAGWVAREFDAAWKEAEVRLRMDDL